ncbi:MAG: class I SAM-dependent methyltransferase [Actinomycetota bacterium]|nr:class I SAM-dependent methyltransferase [Actinomycetota bacterium]
MTRADSDDEYLRIVGDACGVSLGEVQIEKLLAFSEFLGTEGVVSGAIGPNERSILLDRHIADSLVFLRGFEIESGSVLDVGSGVGLPGIPIAIARPGLNVELMDRSQRRSDLASRAVRILRLPNVAVTRSAVDTLDRTWDAITFRASLRIPAAAAVVQGFINPGGMGVFGVSRSASRPSVPAPPEGMRFEMTEELSEVLDSSAWLLRMSIL